MLPLAGVSGSFQVVLEVITTMTPSGGWWPNGRLLVIGGQLARDVERVVGVEVGEGRDGCLGDEPAKSLPHYPHLLTLLGHTLARLYLIG
jgi:hypothetical protein